MEKLHSKQFIIRFMVVGVLLVSLFCLFLSKYEMRITEFDTSTCTPLTEEDGAVYQMIYAAKGYNNFRRKIIVETSGYAYIAGKETNDVGIHVLLTNLRTGVTYKMPTFMGTRPDITEAAGDGINYDNCAFQSGVYTKDESFMNDRFAISILYETGDEKYIIETDAFLE